MLAKGSPMGVNSFLGPSVLEDTAGSAEVEALSLLHTVR